MRKTLWHVVMRARLEINVCRPKCHRQRKTAQGKGHRRHRRYQPRVCSLTGSTSSPGQSQRRWWQRQRLVCEPDLAGSTSSPKQSRCTGGNAGAWHTLAIWRDQHRLPTRVRVTGDNTGDGHAFAIWRDRHSLSVGVSVRTDMHCNASAMLRNNRTLENCLVEGKLQRLGYNVPITEAATSPKFQEQVIDGGLADNVTKFSSM